MSICHVCNNKPSADDIRYSGMCVDCYQSDYVGHPDQLPPLIGKPTNYISFTAHDPLMIAMAFARPAFRRGTSLHKIVVDGWGRGLDPAQTAMEAVHNGYSLCVVLPCIQTNWARMDKLLAAYEADRPYIACDTGRTL